MLQLGWTLNTYCMICMKVQKMKSYKVGNGFLKLKVEIEGYSKIVAKEYAVFFDGKNGINWQW